jgi:Ala-tRNA(Pro) deacylase
MKPHILDYLRNKGATWRGQSHPPRVTAQEIAAVEHVSGDRFAKTVVLEAGDDFVLAVLPAHRRVDLDKVEAELGCDVRMADEARFALLFKDCEIGAMPPLGELYDMPVIVDASLAKQAAIVFNAGTHDETIEMAWDDFARLGSMRLLDISRGPTDEAARAA